MEETAEEKILWTDLLMSSDEEEEKPAPEKAPAPTPAPPPPKTEKLPARGTRIQRSDAEQRRKAVFLTAPLPPPPGRRGLAARTAAAAKLRKLGLTKTPATTRKTATREKTAETPAPPPRPPATSSTGPTDRPSPKANRPIPIAAIGPEPPPPILVEVEPGVIAEIPHFAIHVSRRYRLRTDQGRWMLRFNAQGQLRSSQRLPNDAPQPGG